MAKNEVKNPWITLSGDQKYDNPWINVTEYQVVNPAGGNGIYGKVHFKNKAIGVVAVDSEENTWLVGQYRYALNEYSWEIPEGGGKFNEEPLDAAKRELQEETGFIAKKWSLLTRLHTSNSVTDEEAFLFLAEDLVAGESALEATEADLKTMKIPLKDALNMVLQGEITDSLSMIGLLLVGRQRGL